MPVLPSYRNQSIWTVNQLTGFYIRATLAFNKFNFLTGNGITYCFDSFIPRFSFTLHRRFSDRFSACSEESKMYKSKEAFYTKVEKHLFKKKKQNKKHAKFPWILWCHYCCILLKSHIHPEGSGSIKKWKINMI